MNTIRSTVTTVRINPNGDKHAPYVYAIVRPFEASVTMLAGFVDIAPDDGPTLRFARSEQIFALIDALRVCGETLREEETASASKFSPVPAVSAGVPLTTPATS